MEPSAVLCLSSAGSTDIIITSMANQGAALPNSLLRNSLMDFAAKAVVRMAPRMKDLEDMEQDGKFPRDLLPLLKIKLILRKRRIQQLRNDLDILNWRIRGDDLDGLILKSQWMHKNRMEKRVMDMVRWDSERVKLLQNKETVLLRREDMQLLREGDCSQRVMKKIDRKKEILSKKWEQLYNRRQKIYREKRKLRTYKKHLGRLLQFREQEQQRLIRLRWEKQREMKEL